MRLLDAAAGSRLRISPVISNREITFELGLMEIIRRRRRRLHEKAGSHELGGEPDGVSGVGDAEPGLTVSKT